MNDINDFIDDLERAAQPVIIFLCVVLFLSLVYLLTGCEAIQTRSDSGDARDFQFGCDMQHADGTTLSCKQHLRRDQSDSDKDSGVSVVMPAPVAGQ